MNENRKFVPSAGIGSNELIELQAAALEATANPVLICSRDGEIVWVNRAFEELSGYTRAEALGQSTRLLKSGLQPASFYKNMWEIVLSGERWRGELTNRRKDGSLYSEEMTITPVKDSSGQITHFIAIKLDITERKRAEERMCHLAQAVENSSELIAMCDPDGRVTFVNQALLRATGFEEHEVMGHSFRSAFVSRRNPAGLDEEIRSRTISEGGWRGECLCRRKNDTDFTVFLSTGQIRDAHGTLIGIFGIARDVTEHKLLEEQLRVSQKMEAVGLLAGGVAHDFNNLLGVIMGYSELFLDTVSPDDPRAHQLLEIKKASSRAAGLTRQLLAFSRKQVFQPKILDLNGLLNEFNKMLRRVVGEDIELISALKSDLGRVKADPGQVEQVVMNLVVNSRDAMPKGGKLIIETANVDIDEIYCKSRPAIEPGQYVMLAISDTGSGMDQETQERIFEPFFTTKEQGKGTGLGLATVYGIVKQSGGYIWVYSELEKGTTFKIYFPQVKDAVQIDQTKTSLSPSLQGSETILLVEDAESLRNLISAFLRKSGYTVLVPENSAEAVQFADQFKQKIHLLLTDVVMPLMSGNELAMRLSKTRSGLKVLYMSGYTNDAILRHGVLEPGTFFLEKPFSQEALLRKVREVLDQTEKGDDPSKDCHVSNEPVSLAKT